MIPPLLRYSPSNEKEKQKQFTNVGVIMSRTNKKNSKKTTKEPRQIIISMSLKGQTFIARKSQ